MASYKLAVFSSTLLPNRIETLWSFYALCLYNKLSIRNSLLLMEAVSLYTIVNCRSVILHIFLSTNLKAVLQHKHHRPLYSMYSEKYFVLE